MTAKPPMTKTMPPFPIFPKMSVFVRDVNTDEKFPANIHVLQRLSEVDQVCRPMEMCRYAADFILELMQIQHHPWGRNYARYTVALQIALNWSFLIDQRPICDWDRDTFERFLHFIKAPDKNWVSRRRSHRFIIKGQSVSSKQLVNPVWLPFCRQGSGAPLTRPEIMRNLSIVYRFLSYLRRIGVREKRVPVIRQHSEAPVDRGLRKLNLSPYEMDWLFAYLESKQPTHQRDAVCRFLLATARYTNILFGDLAHVGQRAGMLSQFMTYPRPFQPGDQPRCSPWVFISNPGAPVDKEHPLCLKFMFALKDYVHTRGLQISEALPETRILPEVGKYRGMTLECAQLQIRRQRRIIAEAARNDEQLLNRAKTAAKLEQLSFALVRRSALANLAAHARR